MRKLILLAALTVALPLNAWANSQINFTNSGGTANISTSGIHTNGSGSTVNNVTITDLTTNVSTSFTGSLGTLTFTTGALTNGTLGQYGGSGVTFAGGGSFTITSNGSMGLAPGVLFSGTFQGPVTLTKVGSNLVMSGTVTGTVYLVNGPVYGATTQLTVRMPANFVSGNINISGGSTSVTTVPEPGTLGLLGSGLLGIAGFVRWRYSRA